MPVTLLPAPDTKCYLTVYTPVDDFDVALFWKSYSYGIGRKMDIDYNPENGKVGGGNDAIFMLKRYDFQIFSSSKENDSIQTSMAILLSSM